MKRYVAHLVSTMKQQPQFCQQCSDTMQESVSLRDSCSGVF
jgi:hypothetical protein